MLGIFISDTHNKHKRVSVNECDILFHTGDFSFQGTNSELKNFAEWLDEQPADHIVMVPGNHEKLWEKNYEAGVAIIKKACPRVHILNDSGVTIGNQKIWGSPVTPYFFDWAWNRARVPELVGLHGAYIKDHWDLIPEDTTILLTHGPPYGILDEVKQFGISKSVGCELLLDRVKQIKPDIHAFGHIHDGHGEKALDGTLYINASICDETYTPSNKPIVIDLE